MILKVSDLFPSQAFACVNDMTYMDEQPWKLQKTGAFLESNDELSQGKLFSNRLKCIP